MKLIEKFVKNRIVKESLSWFHCHHLFYCFRTNSKYKAIELSKQRIESGLADAQVITLLLKMIHSIMLEKTLIQIYLRIFLFSKEVILIF